MGSTETSFRFHIALKINGNKRDSKTEWEDARNRALLLPASVVCKVKADPKQAGHVLVYKGRLVVQHSKKRFPSTDPDVVHATVASAKNVKTVLDLSAHIGKPHQQGDIETAFPMTPLWPDLVGTIFLVFPKCLELPDIMVFEM